METVRPSPFPPPAHGTSAAGDGRGSPGNPGSSADRSRRSQGVAFEDLIVRARAGDERAFGSLWTTYQPRLLRYLRVMAGHGDAEDLAAVTWAEVSRSLDRFQGGPEDFRAWIFSIARLRMLDLRRMQARRPALASDEPTDRIQAGSDPAEITDQRFATDEALALVATLPKDQAEIVLLRVVAGLDVAAVAELVGKQPGTVRVSLHRALKKLASRLAVPAEQDANGNEGSSHGA